MEILRKTVSAAVFCGAVAVGGTAAAVSYDFDFTGQSLRDGNSVSYTVGDLSVTVTAGTFSTRGNPSDINFGTRSVDIDRNGLGADSWLDSDGVDGALGNDVLVFTFSQEVTMDTISFTEVDLNDNFAFGGVAGSVFTRIVDFQQVTDPTDVSTFASVSERTGLAFGIGAIQWNDNFRISDLTVSTVPLPASGLMLLGALGLGAGIARRRKARAS